MSDKEIGFRGHCVPKPVDNSFLRWFVEVYQYVAAEQNIDIPESRVVLEIMIVEPDHFHQFVFYLVAIVLAFKKTGQIGVGDTSHAAVGIKAAFAD